MTGIASSSGLTTVRTVGGLIPADLLARILAGEDLDGLTGDDFHLELGLSPKEAANRAWSVLTGAWAGYRDALASRPTDDRATALTREKWLLVVMRELGFGRVPTTPAGGLHADGRSFPVSHQSGAVPIHLLGRGVGLDRRGRLRPDHEIMVRADEQHNREDREFGEHGLPEGRGEPHRVDETREPDSTHPEVERAREHEHTEAHPPHRTEARARLAEEQSGNGPPSRAEPRDDHEDQKAHSTDPERRGEDVEPNGQHVEPVHVTLPFHRRGGW